MRRIIRLDTNNSWQFTMPGQKPITVQLPHTWNNIDGQDGGNDYKRCACTYTTTFAMPEFDPEEEMVWIEFDGVNSSAEVTVNGKMVCRHDGGYQTFRADITDTLQQENKLIVVVDNTPNDRVYPQKADFTFYGGIYRPVKLMITNKNHFELEYFGGKGLKVTPTVSNGKGICNVESYVTGSGTVQMELIDQEGHVVATGKGNLQKWIIDQVHLWDGLEDPYLYTVKASLYSDGALVDEISTRIGFRSFYVDPQKGFFLNGRSYPLHGVSRHQDRKGIGNALTKEMHDEDMNLILEMGCNTIRLAHYQHDQYFYDLCDEKGMVVWAEIPYISEHMPNGRENTISMMKELIVQNYHHASIVCWGVSNEITISTKDKKDMLDNHKVLNDLVHKMDPSRFTTLACYAMCGPFNPVAHITDVVSWNLYLGWYVPGLFLNDLWIGFFHRVYPNRALGYSEYGAEGMPNLHSSKPKIGDHSEEYQAKYHEFMLECFRRHPHMWANHVWNMFDFAADARDQGGEPGMNHKGLVTFDRKIKKDSFYLYKAYWNPEPMVHLCSKRYVDRTESSIDVKVYTNLPEVTLFCDGKKIGTEGGSKVLTFKVPLTGEHRIEAIAGDLKDTAVFKKVTKANPSYKLAKVKNKQKSNWV